MSRPAGEIKPGEAAEGYLENSPELRSLALLIRETDDNLIALVLYRHWHNRQEAVEALKKHLQLPVAEFSLTPQLKNPLIFLKAVPPDERRCLFVYGLEEALPEAAGYLNLQREAFRHIPHAVLFWVTESGLRTLAQKAPDFWAWRSGVFDLRTPGEGTSLAAPHYLISDGPLYADRNELERKISLYLELLRDYDQHTPRDVEFLAGLHLKLAIVLFYLSRYREAEAEFRRALDLYRQIRDRQGELNALGNLGIAYASLGETRKAIGFHEQALEIAQEIGDRRVEGIALGNLGVAYYSLGETRKAIGFFEQVLEIAKEIGNRHGEGSSLGNLGNAYAALGETRKAIDFYEQCLKIAKEVGDHQGESNTLGNLGIAFTTLGEKRKAIGLHEQRLEIAKEIGDRRGQGAALGNIGNAYYILGETHRAIGFYEQQLEIAQEIGDRQGEGIACWNLALAQEKLGNRAAAIALAAAALQIYQQIEAPSVEKVRRQLAAWQAESGKQP